MREPNEREIAAMLAADIESRSPILSRKTERREDPYKINLDGLYGALWVLFAALAIGGLMFYGWTHL
jgi:hypothetical protein